MQFAVIIRMLSGNVIFLTPVIAATSSYSTLSKGGADDFLDRA